MEMRIGELSSKYLSFFPKFILKKLKDNLSHLSHTVSQHVPKNVHKFSINYIKEIALETNSY